MNKIHRQGPFFGWWLRKYIKIGVSGHMGTSKRLLASGGGITDAKCDFRGPQNAIEWIIIKKELFCWLLIVWNGITGDPAPCRNRWHTVGHIRGPKVAQKAPQRPQIFKNERKWLPTRKSRNPYLEKYKSLQLNIYYSFVISLIIFNISI